MPRSVEMLTMRDTWLSQCARLLHVVKGLGSWSLLFDKGYGYAGE